MPICQRVMTETRQNLIILIKDSLIDLNREHNIYKNKAEKELSDMKFLLLNHENDKKELENLLKTVQKDYSQLQLESLEKDQRVQDLNKITDKIKADCEQKCLKYENRLAAKDDIIMVLQSNLRQFVNPESTSFAGRSAFDTQQMLQKLRDIHSKHIADVEADYEKQLKVVESNHQETIQKVKNLEKDNKKLQIENRNLINDLNQLKGK